MITIEPKEKKFVEITPKMEDLLANRILNCSEIDCSATFSNLSNLHMHLVKHHKRSTHLENHHDDSDTIKQYFCPEIECIYHISHNSGKHFSSLKYVRQHYQKMHAEKNFQCEKCEKNFHTEGVLNAHIQICGKKHRCNDCGWEYNSREALLTHAKRKRHRLLDGNSKQKACRKELDINVADKVAIPRSGKVIRKVSIPVRIQPELKDTAVQTADLLAEATQNLHQKAPAKKSEIRYSYPNKVAKREHPPLEIKVEKNYPRSGVSSEGPHNKKTHLEFDLFEEAGVDKEEKNLNHFSYSEDTMNSCFDQLVNSSSSCHIETQTEFIPNILDQMLYSNSHTQTCAEFLSELGLADIQTQTQWSPTSNEPSTSGAHDELLVSTETQTSFTQCLLECSGSTNTQGITQHTQTDLLEGLFDCPENDLIGNFQSTHTQT